jgi:hypothetical protein
MTPPRLFYPSEYCCFTILPSSIFEQFRELSKFDKGENGGSTVIISDINGVPGFALKGSKSRFRMFSKNKKSRGIFDFKNVSDAITLNSCNFSFAHFFM